MSPLPGYKQTAEHIRNRFPKKKQKKSAARKKKTPIHQEIVDLTLSLVAPPQQVTQHQMDFETARAYLTRLDTTPDDQLTPEERFIKRMGEQS